MVSSGSIYKKIFRNKFDHIYKKKSQLFRYIYCLKDFSNPHLMFVFLIIVSIFLILHRVLGEYIYKTFKKLQQQMICLGFDDFLFLFI